MNLAIVIFGRGSEIQKDTSHNAFLFILYAFGMKSHCMQSNEMFLNGKNLIMDIV